MPDEAEHRLKFNYNLIIMINKFAENISTKRMGELILTLKILGGNLEKLIEERSAVKILTGNIPSME